MDGKMPILTLFTFYFYCCFFISSNHAQLLPILNKQIKTYIVHVDRHDQLTVDELHSYHMAFLPNSTLSSGEPRLLVSYRHVMSGFAARLTLDELKSVESSPGFIHAFPDDPEPLDTTHTPEFLGLSQPTAGFWSKHSNKGEGIIIGIIDSGLARDHPSFDDGGTSTPPSKWKGNCTFKGICNNKVVGAVTFSNGKPHPESAPEDKASHGSSIASIAAGNFVENANVSGKAGGTASGMAPGAHLAIYKACRGSCSSTDKLAAGDRAIEDGVDVIVISSGKTALKYYESSTDMIGLAAVRNGILVCASVGNSGKGKSVKNAAPWVLTVGAGTTDRVVDANKTRLAPMVAKFSSRGPSRLNGGILKPDVLAPGAQIVSARAATQASPAPFMLASGTSFAAPHVGGIVALIKKQRPDWSPAMIQSAIITTADSLDRSGNPMLDDANNQTADVFATGAGQVNAERAVNPGLVYDVDPDDHLGYLCGLGYADADFKGKSSVIGRILKCDDRKPIRPSHLNYASISVSLNESRTSETFRRTVTNVGVSYSVYEARVQAPDGVSVSVRPKTLLFTGLSEKKSFEVEVVLMSNGASKGRASSRGMLEWRMIDGRYVVRSPVAVAF